MSVTSKRSLGDGVRMPVIRCLQSEEGVRMEDGIEISGYAQNLLTHLLKQAF